jgi:hypothetical protein
LTGSGLFSDVGSGSGPNRSGSATLLPVFRIRIGLIRIRIRSKISIWIRIPDLDLVNFIEKIFF